MSFFTRSHQVPALARTAFEDDGPPQLGPQLGPEPVGRLAFAGPTRRGRVRAALPWMLNVLAAVVVLLALLMPDRLDRVTPSTFLRLPLEALLGAALVLVLPTRLWRVMAVLGGVGVGVLVLGRFFDMGFYEVFSRPFDPVIDWSFVEDGVAFVSTSFGRGAAFGTAVGAVVLAVAVLGGVSLSTLRMARLVAGHRTVAIVVLPVLLLVWVTCTVLDVQIVAHKPVAVRSAAANAYGRVVQARASLADRQAFADERGVDRFASVPADQLLTGLRGKTVLLVFVESYGRSAVQDPAFAPQVDAVLDGGTRRLAAAGYGARSGWLTSPTSGGGSWLAHSTLMSGLWINNQDRYRQLVTTDRLTLSSAFGAAGWRTSSVEPAMSGPWPEGEFYRYGQIYDHRTLGYRGPKFGYAPMSDQFILSAFQRLELAKAHGPVMGEIVLVSSHAPWTPLPRMVSWEDVGDGSIFNPMPAEGPTRAEVWPDVNAVRAAYRQSIEYSLNSLVSYLETYGDKDTVLVFLGDHQPSSIVTGSHAGHDVPISIVAHDPAVLDRVAGWGWTAGLRPSAQAPVWPMSAFRDRFLTAFGPEATAPNHDDTRRPR